ncbi:MAG: aconitase family protein [Lachnospiraceae bacterium]|nr:aconitase family protein [Lachnospiraceae bacterium]
MKQTLCEKILAKAAGKPSVTPGEYITVKDFTGPIFYSFKGVSVLGMYMDAAEKISGKKISNGNKYIYNEDHNSPPVNADSIRFFKDEHKRAKDIGATCYCREGIGHVVNVEQGDIMPGKVFVHFDPQASNAGGVGAFYTNGGRFGGHVVEAMAFDEITLCVPETIRVVIDGQLKPYISAKDVWFAVQNELGPDGAIGAVVEFDGSAIEAMDIDQRMILCGEISYVGADTALIKSDAKTCTWYKENFGIEAEEISGDSDAQYSRVLHFCAEDIVPMVTYPPEVFTSCPASELKNVAIDQCIIGTCIGGSLSDLRIAANILKGHQIKEGVRFIVSPVTQYVYSQAAREGLLSTLADAGAIVIAPTCDVCFGGVGPLNPGEVSLSQQTLNVPGRSGSHEAFIYLASAATIAASAITGYITSPETYYREG